MSFPIGRDRSVPVLGSTGSLYLPSRGIVEESEAASAEEGSHDVLFLEENLCMEDVKQHNTHRERERGTKSITLLLTKGNNYKLTTTLQKVTKSLYIVTHLGQLT